ncbi:hypothetical protein WIS52_01275 [Pseudonocardia nematodicida]|uniref:OmpA-like domain-containing protein n=1 Tax=Pseudonocardia nematodicida TaxID=1206997 RepID=A0ABV1K3Q3_9PSEU
MRRQTVTYVFAAVLLYTAAGCGTTGPPPEDPANAVAIAVQSNAAALAPDLGDALRADLARRAADPETDDVVVHVVSGRDRVETVDLEPRRPNGHVERGTERIHALVDDRLAELDAAIHRAGTSGDVDDPLAALATAGRTGAGTVVLLSAGVTGTDPIDQRVYGWDRDPGALAADLRDRRLLPDLTGRDVVLGGLGRTTGDQPPLGLREQAALREQWTAICAATGAAACTVDDGIRPPSPPESTVDTPPVPPLPVVTTAGGSGGGPVTWEVPAPLLFRPDSCALLDPAAATRLLTPLVEQLAGQPDHRTVSVSGRAAPVGTGDGIALSRCRAEAAAGILRDAGVPDSAIGEVRGDGSALDPPEASQGPDGRPDPAKLAALRRVVFTLTSTEEA